MSIERIRGTLIGLDLFIAASAIAGAVFVVPGLPSEWIAGTPLTDYRIPALALGVVCGGGSLVAAALVAWRPEVGGIVSVATGAAMAIFEVVEVATVGLGITMYPTEPASYLQPFYFALGLAIAALGLAVWRSAVGAPVPARAAAG